MPQFRAKRLDLGGFINSRIIRDHTRRKVVERFEEERQALRYVIRNTALPQAMRTKAQLELANMHSYTRPIQIRNRCIAGGVARSVMRAFRMGRFQFRMHALAGELPGQQLQMGSTAVQVDTTRIHQAGWNYMCSEDLNAGFQEFLLPDVHGDEVLFKHVHIDAKKSWLQDYNGSAKRQADDRKMDLLLCGSMEMGRHLHRQVEAITILHLMAVLGCMVRKSLAPNETPKPQFASQ